MDEIIMADGTRIPEAWIQGGHGRIYFYIRTGATMASACGLMSDPEKTGTLSCAGAVYTGFTELFILQKTGDMISGGLQRPE